MSHGPIVRVVELELRDGEWRIGFYRRHRELKQDTSGVSLPAPDFEAAIRLLRTYCTQAYEARGEP